MQYVGVRREARRARATIFFSLAPHAQILAYSYGGSWQEGGARAASPPLQGLAPPARRPRAAGAAWEARARAARGQTAGEDLWWWCAHPTLNYVRLASPDRGKYEPQCPKKLTHLLLSNIRGSGDLSCSDASMFAVYPPLRCPLHYSLGFCARAHFSL